MARRQQMSPAEEMSFIKKQHGHRTFERKVQCWLNTGNKRLNAVLGSEEQGIPYGKMLEVYGPNSHGKTLLALFVAALAQADGAEVAWVDLEQSLDKSWVEMQGVAYDRLRIFQLELGYFGNEKEERLETANELFSRVESWLQLRREAVPDGKVLVVVDSIAAILVEEEADAGLTGQNMRTNMSLPMFLSKALRRWIALASACNAMMIFINQIRISPGQWGNPEYAPGGNATKHYCSIRVQVRRVGGGRLLQGRQVVGLRGQIKNVKNKAGAGSVEGKEVGFETRFGLKKWRFPSLEELRREGKEEQ